MVNRAHWHLLKLLLLLIGNHLLSAQAAQHTKESYVVYMGSPPSGGGGVKLAEVMRAAHLEMLASIVPQERRWLTHSYHHAFEGFATELTEEEALALSEHERVVSVFRDPVLQLHTTRSWLLS